MELILQSRQFPDRLNDPLAIYTLREVYVSLVLYCLKRLRTSNFWGDVLHLYSAPLWARK